MSELEWARSQVHTTFHSTISLTGRKYQTLRLGEGTWLARGHLSSCGGFRIQTQLLASKTDLPVKDSINRRKATQAAWEQKQHFVE